MANKEKFEVPAKPWGDAEIKLLVVNREKLNKKTLKELGLGPVEEVEEEESEKETPSEEEVVTEDTPEAADTEQEVELSTNGTSNTVDNEEVQ